MPGGLPGGMLKLRFDWYIIVVVNKSPDLNVTLAISNTNKVQNLMVSMATAGLLKHSKKTIAKQEYPGC